MSFLPSDHLWVLFPDVFMVLTSEVAVDIIKHAFITKFNDITADVRDLIITLKTASVNNSSQIAHVNCNTVLYVVHCLS